MLGFGKNKETAEKNSRYKSTSAKNDKTTDALLITEKAALSASLVESAEHRHPEEPVYDLVVDDESPATSETEAGSGLYAQIEKLACEYEKVNQQLEKSLQTTDELTKQLAQSKQVSKPSYITLGLAGLAFMTGIGASVFAINLQRDIADLQNLLNSLTQQTSVAQNQLMTKDKETALQLAQLNQKVDSAFKTDSLNDVLQVTQELKKQIQALANKNLATLNPQPAPIKPEEVALPSLSLDKTVIAQAEQKKAQQEAEEKKATEQAAENKKNEPRADLAKMEVVKKPATDNLSTLDDSAAEKENGKWFMVFGTFKDKTAVDKFQRAGITVQMTEVKQKNQTRYRISSKTFTSKQEAQQHAAYVQKTLKIRAVLKKAK